MTALRYDVLQITRGFGRINNEKLIKSIIQQSQENLIENCHRNFSCISKNEGLPIKDLNGFKGKSLSVYNPNVSRREVQVRWSSGTPKQNVRQLPRLLYIQNPLVWFSNKMDFRFLRTNWDPQFTEAEFTRGTRQAVSLITQLLSKNMFDSMKCLLTKNALLNLRRDVEILWADEVRRNIALKPEDVQLIIPRKIHFRHVTNPPVLSKFLDNNSKKFCDIDMVFIALKWLDEYRLKNPPLLFIDIIARFHRNYTEGICPEWTVAAFRVRRFNMIPSKKQEN